MVTTYALNNFMNNIFGVKVNPPLPERFWIGLSSTEPNLSGAGVSEPSMGGSGYSRIRLENLLEAVNGSIKNGNAISFEESLTSWGLMTHYVIYDAATNGNLLMYGPLTISRTVEQNTVITFKAGELVVTLENIT